MAAIPSTWSDVTTVGGERTDGQYLYKLTVPTNWQKSTRIYVDQIHHWGPGPQDCLDVWGKSRPNRDSIPGPFNP